MAGVLPSRSLAVGTGGGKVRVVHGGVLGHSDVTAAVVEVECVQAHTEALNALCRHLAVLTGRTTGGGRGRGG